MDRQRAALIRAVRVSVPVTLAAVAVWSLGQRAASRAYESYALAQVYKNLSETTELLAAQSRADLSMVMERMRDLAQEKISPVVADVETRTLATRAPASLRIQTDNSIGWGYLEGPRDMMDLSLWSLSNDARASAQRIYVALNTRYGEPTADLANRLRATEALERELASVVLLGHGAAASEPGLAGLSTSQGSGVLWLGIPWGNAPRVRALVAHIRLERFQGSYRRKGDRRIAGDSAASVALLDSAGNVLAHPDFRVAQRRENWNTHAAYLAARKSPTDNGTLSYGGSNPDSQMLASFSKIGFGQLAVVASISRADAMLGLTSGGLPLWSISLLAFVLFTSVAYFLYSGDWRSLWEAMPQKMRSRITDWGRSLQAGGLVRNTPFEEPDLSVSQESKPEIKKIAVIHGSLRHMQDWIARIGAEPAAQALNEFLTIAAHRTELFGGTFERSAGASFLATFGLETAEGTEVWRALRAALEIRKDLFSLNEARRTDGEPLLQYGMGVHLSEGLVARIGPADSRKLQLVGEVTQYARALDQVASREGQDILVSAAAWSASEGRFQGAVVAEARLTADTGLAGLYQLDGYVNESGESVSVQAQPVEREAGTQETRFLASGAESRWLVNNGSQIEGPLTADEIASRLFAQELDFDSECWKEGSGSRSEIGLSSVFSGSNDADATLWVYDGKTLHGPISRGFLQTAVLHGALSEDHHVCDRTTVSGWTRVADFLANRSVTGGSHPAAGASSPLPEGSGSPQAA